MTRTPLIIKCFGLVFYLCLTNLLQGQTVSDKVKVNQIGYLTSEEKVAYVSSSSALSLSSWSIRKSSDNSVVYQSSAVSSGLDDEASGEIVYTLYFSDFEKEGSFYLNVSGVGRSYDFEVSKSVYNDVFDIVMKGFYYQRSGVALTSQYAGKWAKPAEYANDAFIYEGFNGSSIVTGGKVDAAGGWRDAGDPNKKVVPASIAVHQLLTLYEYFPTFISKSNTNIPTDPSISGLSDFLTEAKVCLDWLLTMQRADGAVWHGVGQEDFELDVMGHLDPNDRYLMPVSTTATADFAAAMAIAYRVFKDKDAAYANNCLAAAEQAWTALNTSSIWNNPTMKGDDGSLQYPEQKGYSSDPPGINNTVVYEDTEDIDERHWAAGELAISTDKAVYHNFFKTGIGNGIWYPSLWPAVGNLSNFSYAMAFRNESNPTTTKLKQQIRAYMDIYLARINSTGFRTCLSPADYYWGSNNLAGQFAYTFLLAYEILGDDTYKDGALSMLNYILGANSLNQTFVSGIGDKPVQNIFHLPSWLDGIDEVVPGLIPGGPNQFITPSDVVHANYLQAESPAPAKCYLDSQFSFSSNETVILESSVWAFVTGYFYYIEIDDDNDGYTIENDCDDDNASINPGETEVPYNGLDDDCNAMTLDDDLDQDGFVLADDCDDNNSSINPEETEIPYNGIDEDCDASTLDDDLDQDGFLEAEDCDDTDASINPDAMEIPNNEVDEDCDGEILLTSTKDFIESPWTLYPNPTRETLLIRGDLNGSLNYTIVSTDGIAVRKGIYQKKGINLSDLLPGMYMIRLASQDRMYTKMFVKI